MKIKDYNSFSDEQIIAEILGDRQTGLYSILYARYHQKVLDKCYSMLKNRSLAEEFSGDILSKAYEKLSSFRNISSFSSWLFSLTYNYCIDYLRLSKKLHYPEYDRKNRIPEIIDETSEELEEITYENFLEILEMIHPEEKALLLMKYKDNIPIRQIAEAIRITESAAKMRIKRAKTRVIYLYAQKFLKSEQKE